MVAVFIGESACHGMRAKSSPAKGQLVRRPAQNAVNRDCYILRQIRRVHASMPVFCAKSHSDIVLGTKSDICLTFPFTYASGDHAQMDGRRRSTMIATVTDVVGAQG
jgi:hypothetical protein